MKILTVIFLLIGSIAFAKDMQYENIDLEQINKSLPRGWYVSTISSINAPTGWSKISGSKGLRLEFLRVPYSFKLHKTKPGGLTVYQPNYTICIFPKDFSGKSADGTIFKNGKEIVPIAPPNLGQLILYKIKSIKNFYFFYIPHSFKDWEKPDIFFDKIVKGP